MTYPTLAGLDARTLTILHDLRDLGLIGAERSAAIEAAFANGKSAVVARAVDELEAVEADAAFIGLDADVHALRTSLAASIGYQQPVPLETAKPMSGRTTLKQGYAPPVPEEMGAPFVGGGVMRRTGPTTPDNYVPETEVFDQGHGPLVDDDGFYLNNAWNEAIDPQRFTIGIRNNRGEWGVEEEDGTFRPYNAADLAAFAEALTGLPVIFDGIDQAGRAADFIVPGMGYDIDGGYFLIDGVRQFVINGQRHPDVQAHTLAHEIAHPLSVAIAANPEYAAVLAANRERLDQLGTFVNSQPLAAVYQDLDEPQLDEERFAEFMRQYIMDPHWVRRRFPDLVKILIPLIYEVQGADGPYQIVQFGSAVDYPVA